MLKTFRAFLEFCYIARAGVLDTKSLTLLTDALKHFHDHRVIFEECGVRADGFALPRQHALSHYPSLIRAFGVPNGLCSSIIESKHIKAVKEPWRHSGCHEALGQMLLTNQRLDKLAVSRVDFRDRGMLDGTCLESECVHLSLRESFSLPLGVSHINKYLPCIGPQLPNHDAPQPVDPAQSQSNVELEDDDSELDGAIAGPRVMASVELVKTPSCE